MTEMNRENKAVSVNENRRLRKERIERRKKRKRKKQRRLILIGLIMIGIGVYAAKNMIFNKKDVTDLISAINLSTNEKEVVLSSKDKIVVENPYDISVLVNKKRALPSDYAPEDLVVPDVPSIFEGYAERKNLRQAAAGALEELFNAAKSDAHKLIAVSGYRPYDYQKQLFDNEVAQCGSIKVANEGVARPGESEHQTGLAMDICASVSGDVLGDFEGTPEAQWVYEHCHKYGFIVRYPKGKSDITGYMYEPWHIRYVGKEIAAGVKETGLTYEEYYKVHLENKESSHKKSEDIKYSMDSSLNEEESEYEQNTDTPMKIYEDNSENIELDVESSSPYEKDEYIDNEEGLVEIDENNNGYIKSTMEYFFIDEKKDYEEDIEDSIETYDENEQSINEKITIKNTDDISVLVNKKRALPSDYPPEDLVVPDVTFIFEGYAERKNLREPAANALEELFNAAKLDGYKLIAVSGYRPYDYQKQLFDNEVAQCGSIEAANGVVAMPGESEHQTGLAMDICSSVSGNVLGSFEGTSEAQWVYEHCHEYGFIVRYPKRKSDITGYMYEPWHIRYVGEQIACDVKESGLTYDEYYETYIE